MLDFVGSDVLVECVLLFLIEVGDGGVYDYVLCIVDVSFELFGGVMGVVWCD